jgi:hypothetical protein
MSAPPSGTVLSRPREDGSYRANEWHPGTYLLYQRGTEYYRPGEEPPWLEVELRSSLSVGDLPAYEDEATHEIVPVLRVV